MMQVQIKKIHDDAHSPSRNSAGDAGYDLYAIGHDIIKAGERQLVSTGISISIPRGYYGRVAPRSGLALRDGIDVLAGVIDAGYRGEVGVILMNFGDKNFAFRKGDRIAQLIIEKCHEVEWQEVDELNGTTRGDDGFGSSGE
jgi:dUTP pyrophosphatase